MLSVEDKKAPKDILVMLAGVQEMIAGARYCWLVTRSDGGVRARPMGRLLPSANDDDWTIRFVTDCRSRKVADLRHVPTVSLIFQNERDHAFASVTGAVRLVENAAEVRALWNEDAYACYFPTKTDRANAGFIEVRLERMELWIRGVTPEPFGLHTTTLQRDPQGAWYLAA